MTRKKAARSKAVPHRIERGVAREYEAIVRAIQALEHALASPAPTRQEAWRKTASRDLAKVTGLLQEHCEVAESDRGLVSEVERTLGRPRILSHVQQDHQRLPREAVLLLGAIDHRPRAKGAGYNEIRQRGWDLIARLRRHQAREADLLIELRERDVGAQD